MIPERLNWKGRFVVKMEEGEAHLTQAVPNCPNLVQFGRYSKKSIHAKVLSVENPPEYVVEPPCNVFGACGGCSFQHVNYETQLQWKKDLFLTELNTLFDRYPPRQTIFHAAEQKWHYRNKMEFTFLQNRDRERFLGLHELGQFQKVVNVDNCAIQLPSMQEVLSRVQTFLKSSELSCYNPYEHEGVLRHLVLRGSEDSGAVMVNLVVTEHNEEVQSLLDSLAELDGVESVYWTRNNRVSDAVIFEELHHVYGSERIIEKVGEYEFEVSPQSFYQTNSSGMKSLYDIIFHGVESYLSSKKGKLIDFYCGAGSIGIYLSELFDEVVGVEEVDAAVKDANANLKRNGIQSKFKFFQGKVEGLLDHPEVFEDADVLVVDPPRVGCHKKARQLIKSLKVPFLVYVACSQKTLAENIQDFLESGYELERVELLDLFPQTPHVESVSFLRYRG